MNTTENCQIDDGFVNYLVFTYCSFTLDFTWFAIILLVIKNKIALTKSVQHNFNKNRNYILLVLDLLSIRNHFDYALNNFR